MSAELTDAEWLRLYTDAVYYDALTFLWPQSSGYQPVLMPSEAF